MKHSICLLIAICLAVVFAERPVYRLQKMDWTSPTLVIQFLSTCATKKDLLVYPVRFPNVQDGNGAEIRRRNSDGEYVLVAHINDSYIGITPATNGKWIAFPSSQQDPFVYMYSIDQNNVVSSQGSISAKGGYILSDDTFVGQDPLETPDVAGNYTIRTWEYDSTIGNWTEVPNTELKVPALGYYLGDYASYRVTDTHLVFNDYRATSNNSILIFERQQDKSWSFVESVPVNSSLPRDNPNSPFYNGVDTLVSANGVALIGEDYLGSIFVYTKKSGVWHEQSFLPKALGYRPAGLLGLSIQFVDPDTMLVSVVGDGYGLNSQIDTGAGKVLVLTRDVNGFWKDSLDMVGDPIPNTLFGIAVGVNDYDVVVPQITAASGDVRYYTAPLCFNKPINVTCYDQQLSNCSSIDISSLYTVNNPECGEVDASLTSLQLINSYTVNAELSFVKKTGFGAPVACTAKITCPAPPITSQVPIAAPARVSTATSVPFCLFSLIGFLVVM